MRQMLRQIKNIATIQMGYSFRKRLDALPPGQVAAIQMKDLDNRNLVVCDDLLRVSINNLKEHHLATPGDLIFRSRGQVTTAALLAEDPGLAVVAAPLIRIRANQRTVLPEYLAWYINQPALQAEIAGRARGTSVKMISKQTLSNLAIKVPPLERQRSIVALSNLANKEQQLIAGIAERRKQLVSRQLMQLIETALTDTKDI